MQQAENKDTSPASYRSHQRRTSSRDSERSHALPFWMGSEMPWTNSTEAQWETERRCEDLYLEHDVSTDPLESSIALKRKALKKFMLRGFDSLPSSYLTLDSSHPWLCFWILNGLRVLGEDIPVETAQKTISIIRACQTSTGGFGGGPAQAPHLAGTYAACMALCCVGTEEALSVIDRVGLKSFLFQMRQPSGAFTMCEDGEEDTRAVYCAVAVATLLDIPLSPLFDLAPDWLSDCQTYEGGFGAIPGAEAHGGYTYCSFTALYLLNKPTQCRLDDLCRWLSFRQMRYEGGFQGRTNKLVDSCYTFWQGAVFPLLQQVLKDRPDYTTVPMDSSLFDHTILQQYVLVCCQNVDGGISDKPGKGSDYYHTCYALAGLSIAQHNLFGDNDEIWGPATNRLEEMHPAFNLTIDCFFNARSFFIEN
ncbi:Protein farnesyltransferase subunit beta [Hypsibius exemplaris]|uniref:Protein farnesyltransferase subunit beta n=1 Tax=Hypsibius exemplaris TaxID=2072580 RepID=A0A1W0X918_HYPEX|nr:Protein farnesyltransferase subunit beta [Hypsibius exemplaris]